MLDHIVEINVRYKLKDEDRPEEVIAAFKISEAELKSGNVNWAELLAKRLIYKLQHYFNGEYDG